MSLKQNEVFDAVGGQAFFEELVNRFYDKVEQDEVLANIFPPKIEEGRKLQTFFQIQLFGGPKLYYNEKGPPKLKPFHDSLAHPINQPERDRWVCLMLETLDEMGVAKESPARQAMEKTFNRMATMFLTE